MQLQGVYTQLGILFLLMFFGYILGRIKIITSVGTEAFSKFIVKVALPAVMISGLMIPVTPEKLHGAISILVLSIATYGLACGVAIPFSKLLTQNEKERGIYSFAIIFSNSGFMGIPVLQAIYGKEAILYVVTYGITFNLLLFTLGIKLMSTQRAEKNKFNFKLLINPGIVASIIGLILFVTGIPLPKFVVGAIDLLGGVCTPLSMVTIGAMLSTLPIRNMFSNGKIYLLAVVRLMILPLLTLVLLKYVFRIDDMWLLGVPVIIAGMPVATNTGMMAEEYGNNPALASQTILISTVLSCLTIPLLVYLV